MEKWIRANYQPPIALGEGGARVTGSKEHIALSRKAAAEGMVLLKNENNTLPFPTGAKVALFGKGCIDYVKGGGGSGDVTVAYVRNLYEGLKEYEKQGKVRLFHPLAEYYQENVKAQYAKGAMPGMTIEPEVPEELLQEAKVYTDTAIISICRYSGEDWDRKLEGTEVKAAYEWSQEFLDQSDEIFDRGDFYLTKKEQAMVDIVKENFAKVVVVMNVGGMVDSMWFAKDDAISAVLMSWQAGMEGGYATADILLGIENPSGRLTDTFAKEITDYPSTEVFHESPDYAEYVEDIYVGYRYFETVPGMAERVNYPFGFGLSYTRFQWEMKEVAVVAENGQNIHGKDGVLSEHEVAGAKIKLTFDISNLGTCAGKEVLQLYYGAPQGELGKPKKVLGAFVKTRRLQAGETQRMTLTMPVIQMASYDDEGKVMRSAYVLEEGRYPIYFGNNVRDAREVMAVTLRQLYVVEQLTSKCAPYKLSRRMLSDGSFVSVETREYPEDTCVLKRQDFVEYEGVIPDVAYEPLRQMPLVTGIEDKQLIDVAKGKITLEEFMEQLSLEDLLHLVSGHRGTGVTNTGSMGGLSRYGVPLINTADGPAGLRIEEKCQVFTTAFPCATLLASTWNPEIVQEIGVAGAKEVKENNIGLWLTPAINIHRSPLCGRNFEYYSEDPYLSGKIGAAMVQGMQSQNIGASVKHLVCNNKETNRKDSDSIVSERALREIYLKAFEIVVKEAAPWTIMSSYNLLNGVHTSENKELLTDILRGEWNYQGLVTSDWWTHAEHYLEIKAGNDVKMMNGYVDRVKEAVSLGDINEEDIALSAKRVLEMILKQE